MILFRKQPHAFQQCGKDLEQIHSLLMPKQLAFYDISYTNKNLMRDAEGLHTLYTNFGRLIPGKHHHKEIPEPQFPWVKN